MISLEKSPRFQEDYSRYKTKIDKIKNPKVKADAESLLKTLVREVKGISEQHSMLNMKNSLSSMIDDSRSKISEIRKKLDRIVKEAPTN